MLAGCVPLRPHCRTPSAHVKGARPAPVRLPRTKRSAACRGGRPRVIWWDASSELTEYEEVGTVGLVVTIWVGWTAETRQPPGWCGAPFSHWTGGTHMRSVCVPLVLPWRGQLFRGIHRASHGVPSCERGNECDLSLRVFFVAGLGLAASTCGCGACGACRQLPACRRLPAGAAPTRLHARFWRIPAAPPI